VSVGETAIETEPIERLGTFDANVDGHDPVIEPATSSVTSWPRCTPGMIEDPARTRVSPRAAGARGR
jgi:hypothetical protein